MGRSIFAFEELEIEKLEDKEKELAATPGGDVLYDNLVDESVKQDAPEEEVVEDTDTPVGEDEAPVPDPDAEETPDTASSDEPPKDSETPEEADQAKAGEDEPSLEELKNLTYSQESIGELAVSAGNHILNVAVPVFKYLGLTVAPFVLKNAYKGVVYVLVRMTRLLYSTSVVVSKYIERRVNSFNNLSQTIQALKQTLGELEDRGDLPDVQGETYSKQSVINTLKIGESVDFIDNLTKLSGFVSETIADLDQAVLKDIGAARHLMALSQAGAGNPPSDIMSAGFSADKMTEGEVQGYAAPTDQVKCLKYNEHLPSDVILLAMLPKQDLVDLGEITRGYNHSSIFLGFDSANFKQIDRVDYMALDQLKSLVDNLEKVCALCIEHESVYRKIDTLKTGLKYSVKRYAMALFSKTTKTSLHDSLAEHIYLKLMFADKVYTTSMIDIHDYTARVITHGISFAKANIKKLS